MDHPDVARRDLTSLEVLTHIGASAAPVLRMRNGSDRSMTPQLDISILETSFDLIAPRREELVDRFYRTLFSKAPTTRALFVQAEMRAQKCDCSVR